MIRASLRTLFSLLLFAAVLPVSLVAQDRTTTLSGRVVDERGAAVAGAQVVVRGESLAAPRRAVADAAGRYTITGLPPGRYSVRFRQAGLGTGERRDVRVGGGTTVLDFVLGGEAVPLEELAVTAYAETRQAASATRTPVPVMETPVAVQVVPGPVLRHQAVLQLQDAYRNVSGVVPDHNGLANSDRETALIRGFRNGALYRNGDRTRSAGVVDLAGVERVEVLKGPASVLYGLVEPGGVVNYVTKKPLAVRRVAAEQSVGSDDLFRTTLDAGGPLAADGRLLGRVNLAYTSSGSFRDYVGLDRLLVAPSLLWHPTGRTTLLLEASSAEQEFTTDPGVAFSAEGRPVAPIRTFLGEPSLPESRLSDRFAGYTLTHEMGSGLRLRNALVLSRFFHDFDAYRTLFGTEADGTTVARREERELLTRSASLVTDLLWEFGLGASAHTLLTGVDLRWEGVDSEDRRASTAPIDIVRPTYGSPPGLAGDPRRLVERRRAVGVFAQDQATLGAAGRLHLLAGGRFDYVEQEEDFRTSPSATPLGGRSYDAALTGRLGALYDLSGAVSVYGNVAQSFLPQSTFNQAADATVIEPERGLQFETGLKFSLLGERLIGTAAAFQIDKENVAVADPADPDFVVNGGELRSRGVELDASGALGMGWSTVASYAWTSTEVVRSDALPVGAPFRNVPEHSGSVWVAYDAPTRARVAGLGGGAGVFAVGERAGDDENSFRLDGYSRVDASLWYRRPVGRGLALRFQLNARNLLDQEHYVSSYITSAVEPGAPRSLLAQVGVEF